MTGAELLQRFARSHAISFKSEGPCGSAVITTFCFTAPDGTKQRWATDDGGQTYKPIKAIETSGEPILCSCSQCYGKDLAVGVSERCEYHDHHCDACHERGICTTQPCASSMKVIEPEAK